MKRISVTEDGHKTGRWFDIEKAERLEEDIRWNGNNHISKATGSQWEHESLYITTGGVFILNHWSNYQGSLETYEIISKEEAAEWLVRNEYTDEQIPEIFKEQVYNLEIK